jgi:hypothetical protein
MQQVTDWLEKLGLGQYAQRFAENDINFGILPHLTDQDLKELGVFSLGHRRQLLLAIAELDGVQKDAVQPPAATEAPIVAAQTGHSGDRVRASYLANLSTAQGGMHGFCRICEL